MNPSHTSQAGADWPFSLSRAILALSDDPLGPAWQTSYERDFSDSVARGAGVAPRPGVLFLPLGGQRDLTVANGGAALVGSSNPGGRFMASLQQASVLAKAGAETIVLDQQDAVVPVATAAPTITWMAGEDKQITDTQPTFGARTSTPKFISARATFSRQLLLQSSVAIENMLVSEMGRAIAAEIDRVALQGTGANGQPLGLTNISTVPSAAGTSLTWPNLTALVKVIREAKVANDPSFIATPAVADLLHTRSKFSNTDTSIADALGAPGWRLFSTTAAPTSGLIVGDFTQCKLFTWGTAQILVDPFTGWRSGQIGLRVIVGVDVVYEFPSTFRRLESIT